MLEKQQTNSSQTFIQARILACDILHPLLKSITQTNLGSNPSFIYLIPTKL